MSCPKVFGTLPDGRTVYLASISNDRLKVELITWGAVVRDLRFTGFDQPMVLGLNTLRDYLEHSPNFGSTLGRCANRILGGRFELDGLVHFLDCNETEGPNCLHGGANGTSKALWEIEELRADRVTLAIIDPAGNAGFPGDVHIRADFRLMGSTLRIRYESTASAATPVNIAHHAYFNLGGDRDIRRHRVQIAAESFLEIDPLQVGRMRARPVAGTDYDFRSETVIGPRIERAGGFDNNYCLSENRQALRPVARLSAPGGPAMEIATTEPGLQLYTSDKLDCPVQGLQGRRYGSNAGICFETQNWPNAVNQPGFPDVILRPGQSLVQETHLSFLLS